jgi:hypothetical protein
MTQASAHKPFAIGALRITPDHIEKVQDGRPLYTIPRTEVRSARLENGLLARHPVFQAVFGIAVTCACGAWLIVSIKLLLQHVMTIWAAAAFPLAALGPWILFDAFRRGCFLDVRTDKGRFKITVARRLTPRQEAVLTEQLSALPDGRPH